MTSECVTTGQDERWSAELLAPVVEALADVEEPLTRALVAVDDAAADRIGQALACVDHVLNVFELYLPGLRNVRAPTRTAR